MACADDDDMFTPPGRPEQVRKKDFLGFRKDEGISMDSMLRKRVIDLECQVRELFKRLEVSDRNYEVIRAENAALRSDCCDLPKQLRAQEVRVAESKDQVKEMNEKQSVWRKEREEEQESFKKIMEGQIREENVTKTVVKVIKEKSSLVRDTVEKKRSVVVFGLKEEKMPLRHEREVREKKVAEGVLVAVQDGNTEARALGDDIEEVVRLGKYEEGKQRPMRIRMRSQVVAEQVLAGSWRLAKREEYKKVWVRPDLNEEERAKLNELWNEAKEKNQNRSETEKKKFYWRIKDMRLRKWYIKEEQGAQN